MITTLVEAVEVVVMTARGAALLLQTWHAYQEDQGATPLAQGTVSYMAGWLRYLWKLDCKQPRVKGSPFWSRVTEAGHTAFVDRRVTPMSCLAVLVIAPGSWAVGIYKHLRRKVNAYAL